MSVLPVDVTTLEHPAATPDGTEPRVPVTASLSEAFAAALASPDELAAVYDGDRYVGSFSATSLLEALRRSGANTSDGGSDRAGRS